MIGEFPVGGAALVLSVGEDTGVQDEIRIRGDGDLMKFVKSGYDRGGE